MTQPIYNEPSHRHYGAARRLHLILMQVYADLDLGRIERVYREQIEEDWTASMSKQLAIGCSEASIMRSILALMDTCADLTRRRDLADRVACS